VFKRKRERERERERERVNPSADAIIGSLRRLLGYRLPVALQSPLKHPIANMQPALA
jgi:hypothetical protein